ncbi:hypothetical protein CC1G_14817 [Coprinopsis cinerea okayama7|uniref:lytic cellulose monooxygenase (C4-dehydrogenating) n=1 Tax=Coprinopsis cinerea (strain Okayama-7 / 130 / ATCC MYA-4618 / FGSC 9003) TaxID=240176 RepID=D6RNP5_COPC7|nr:hypothetical protein CC1G_14817 [Coprinopsis cinerea okayama7\|eukprot:XP_002910838.1 hypothetical protein CC1G_14817 [Coprinopsis cinerea okayama7\
MRTLLFVSALWVASAWAHYTFPVLRVEDVNDPNLRCFDSKRNHSEIVQTYDVPPGSEIGFGAGDGGMQYIFHHSVTNVYMAEAPKGIDVREWDGDGQVWFKVHEIPMETDGGNYVWFPSKGIAYSFPTYTLVLTSTDVQSIDFTLPPSLPPGQYLVRMENIAIHYAMNFGGAQFFLSCAQINILESEEANNSTAQPGPLVAIPGVYNGREPGILINIHNPIPKEYIQPGPPGI